MVDYDRADLICLHLAVYDDACEQSPVPSAVTAAGIGDALELGDTATSRVDLLDSLDTLEQAGLVRTDERQVDGYANPRPVYFLTDAGRDRARTVRERLRGQSVEVTNGRTEQIPLSAIETYIESETPLVTALARLTDDGTVPLSRSDGDAFVGRNDALQTVIGSLEASFIRNTRTVVVGGGAGMGKTTLIREALDRIRQDHENVLVATGASAPGASDPYTAFRQLFESLAEGGPLRARLTEAASMVPPPDPETVQSQRTALFDDIADGLRERASQPIVVFLENLHWADAATMALFNHLTTELDDWVHPLALVGTYRTPVVTTAVETPLEASFEQSETISTVTLEALSWSETRALLADVVDRQRLPEEFVDLVYEQTGGNPLFVRETATHLLETGQADPQADSYPTSSDAVSLPQEVTEQIDQRLATLDDESRELLRLGAVLGERIPGTILAAASDLSPATRREYVDVLVGSRIWERVGDEQHTDETVATDGSGDLQFVSGGLREAVVDRLSEADAVQYHRRVADAFVCAYEDTDEQAARIAYHYEQSHEFDDAIASYRRAGDRARDAYAHEDAIENYERALSLAREHGDGDGSVQAMIYADIAEVYDVLGEYDDALETVEDGLAVAPEPSRGQCRLLATRASVYFLQGEYDRVWGTADRSRTLATELGAADLEARALQQLGGVARETGDYEQAHDYYEEALALTREDDDPRGEADCRASLGKILFYRGEYDQAREQYQHSLDVARSVGDELLVAKILNNLGLIARRTSEYEQARKYHDESLEIRRRHGDKHGLAASLSNLGLVAYVQNEFEQAREYHERSLEHKRELGERQGEAQSLGNLGLIAKNQGEYEQARRYFQQSLEITRELGNRRNSANTLGNIGTIALQQCDYETARSYFQETVDLARELGEPHMEAIGLLNLGHVAYELGELDRSQERYEETLAFVRDLEDRSNEGEALVGLGKIAQQRGAFDRARTQFEQTLEIARELDVTERVARSHRWLAAVARRQESFDRAATQLDRAAEALAGVDQPQEPPKLHLERAQFALARGNHETARERAEQAHQAFEELDGTHWAGRAQRLLGRAMAEAGHRDDARRHWRRAIETFEAVDASHDVLATLEHLVVCEEDGQRQTWCQRAASALAAAPDATAELHREWVDARCD